MSSISFSSLLAAHPFIPSCCTNKSDRTYLAAKRAIQRQRGDSWSLPWDGRLIQHLETWEKVLHQVMPNNALQKRFDVLLNEIEKKFRPLHKFNEWLDGKGSGEWYKQLALFLIKLPLKVARNYIRLIYLIVRTVFTTAVHPIVACNRLCILLIKTLRAIWDAIWDPRVHVKIGANMIGASLGYLLIAGPATPYLLSIGISLVIAGIVNVGFHTPEYMRYEAVKEQIIALPQHLLNGFCFGAIAGGINVAVH